jgi:hypothetical protein
VLQAVVDIIVFVVADYGRQIRQIVDRAAVGARRILGQLPGSR